jgi:hypothetical protein
MLRSSKNATGRGRRGHAQLLSSGAISLPRVARVRAGPIVPSLAKSLAAPPENNAR